MLEASLRRRGSMRHAAVPSRQSQAAAAVAVASALLCASCAMPPSQEELEAAKNTFTCASGGARVMIRFETGEARLLLPDGDRVFLYRIPTASGVRYSNGQMELRGQGTDLQLVRDGVPIPLADCQPYQPPK
jgi:membrane-bound inhibitor of C-type lysozyme